MPKIKTGMIDVPFDSDFEEMKKSIRNVAQNSEKQTSSINSFLLEKHTMDELLKYAKDLNDKNFKTAVYYKGHFKTLRNFDWIVEEKDGLYQIVGHKQCTKIDTSSGQELNIPTKADATTLLLKAKKQIILYGPPGTGKTFNTKTIALNILKN